MSPIPTNISSGYHLFGYYNATLSGSAAGAANFTVDQTDVSGTETYSSGTDPAVENGSVYQFTSDTMDDAPCVFRSDTSSGTTGLMSLGLPDLIKIAGRFVMTFNEFIITRVIDASYLSKEAYVNTPAGPSAGSGRVLLASSVDGTDGIAQEGNGAATLIDPFTKKAIAPDKITQEYVDELIRRFRRHFKEKIMEIGRRYNAGEDRDSLIQEIIEDCQSGESWQIKERTLEIIRRLAENNKADPNQYIGAFWHRVLTFQNYQNMEVFIESGKLNGPIGSLTTFKRTIPGSVRDAIILNEHTALKRGIGITNRVQLGTKLDNDPSIDWEAFE